MENKKLVDLLVISSYFVKLVLNWPYFAMYFKLPDYNQKKLIYLHTVVVQLPNRVWLFATPWTAAHQASLSLTRICPSLCHLNRWCHPVISSSVTHFFYLQSFPASRSFPISRLFASGGQSIVYLHICPSNHGLPGGAVVKNLPVIQETQVQSLGQEELLQKEMATHSSILAQEIPWMEGRTEGWTEGWTDTPSGCKESDMTEWLTHTHAHAYICLWIQSEIHFEYWLMITKFLCPGNFIMKSKENIYLKSSILVSF